MLPAARLPPFDHLTSEDNFVDKVYADVIRAACAFPPPSSNQVRSALEMKHTRDTRGRSQRRRSGGRDRDAPAASVRATRGA